MRLGLIQFVFLRKFRSNISGGKYIKGCFGGLTVADQNKRVFAYFRYFNLF